MFVQCTKDNRGGRDGCYCALVKTIYVNGRPRHEVHKTFGFLPTDRIPYLKAAFNDGDPAQILSRELAKIENPDAKK